MFKDVETSVILLYIGAAGVALYFLFQFFQGVSNAPGNLDPTTGQSNGLLNGLAVDLFPVSNPGGGTVTGTSETYSGALSQFLSHPIDVTSEVLGANAPW